MTAASFSLVTDATLLTVYRSALEDIALHDGADWDVEGVCGRAVDALQRAPERSECAHVVRLAIFYLIGRGIEYLDDADAGAYWAGELWTIERACRALGVE